MRKAAPTRSAREALVALGHRRQSPPQSRDQALASLGRDRVDGRPDLAQDPIRAGLLVSDVSVALDEAAREVGEGGEIVGPGKWLAYIEPDEWYRLRHERSERARNQGRSRGRPEVALLGGLARCEQCGEAIVIQRAGEPIDGTRRRTSTCRAHLHRRGDCDALPFDAEEVEATVLGGLDRILDRSTAWADAQVAGRGEEQARMKAEVDVADAEIAECEQAMEKLVDDFDAASVADDDATKELTRRAL